MPKSAEVEAWLARYENPMKPVVLRVREHVLAADRRMGECIKWQAPTFTYEGNLASFFPKSKTHASLMFHQGAKVPGKHPRLVGTGDTSRVLKVATLAEADAARADIAKIVRAWCEWRDGRVHPAAGKRASTVGKTARKADTTGAAKRRSSGRPRARGRAG